MANRSPPASQHEGCSLGGIALTIVVLLGLISQCGKDEPVASDGSDYVDVGSADAGQGQDANDWPGVAPATMAKAARQAARAVGALGADGARTYSENCVAALERRFAIDDYDRCYAFELFAGQLVASDPFYTPYAIDSRWTRTFGSASDAALSDRRKAIAATARGMTVSPEAPPVPAAVDALEEPADGKGGDMAIVTLEEPVGEEVAADEEPSAAPY